jgi:hypothetical protein
MDNQAAAQQVVPPANVQPINDGNNDGDGNVPIHHAQAVQGADGGISLKVEQTKLPEFWGQKEKDSITPNAFIQRVDNMMAANGWTDHITFRNFALVLRGSADAWLKSQQTLEDIKGDRRTWTIVRPLFKAEFAIDSDDKLILDGLAHLAMKPSENVRDYFSRLDETNNIIMDAYDSYTILPLEPVLQNQADTLLMRAYVRECNLNVAKFFLLNHFRAGLPSELRRVLNLQNQDELKLNQAVKLATIEQRSREEAKNRNKIFATDISSKDSDDTQIDALRQNFNYQRQSSGRYPAQSAPNNQQRQQNKSWRQNNQGNNFNRNGQTCIFCKMQNHRQEECRKRIKANKPCLDSNGRPFWPKVNAADSNPTNSVEAPTFTFQDFQ